LDNNDQQSKSGPTQGLFSELGRRRVLRVAFLYAAVAWSITEVLSFLLDALPIFPEGAKALIAILFVLGFPVAMFLAWRFDIGPDGIERTQSSATEKRMTVAGAFLLLIGATAGLFYLIYPSVIEQAQSEAAQQNAVRGEAAPNTIAVLAFTNASANPDDLYMSEGLGDELRDQLGRIAGLRVAARSSSVIFRETDLGAVGIAAQLGVAKLVEGTLRRQGDQLRISVQIIDGATGFQDWTQSYDRTAFDLLAIQQEIATEVVVQILPESDSSVALSDPATTDVSAHDLMLLARHYFQRVRDNPVVDLQLLVRAIDLYQKATIVDPDSALAQSRLGSALLYLGDVESAEKPIFTALALNPDLSEVQYTLGLYRWLRLIPGSGEAHQLAIELNPNNVHALDAYAKWIWTQPEVDAAEPYFLRALELDPMSVSRYRDLGNYYGISGRREETIEIADRISTRFDDPNALLAIARLHETTGEFDVAIAWALRAHDADPEYQDATWMLAELYARIGDFESARLYIAEPDFILLYWERRYEEMIELGEELVLEQPNQDQLWFYLARAYNAIGNFDQAIYVLENQQLPKNLYVDSRHSNAIEASVTLADALNSSGQQDRVPELGNWLRDFFQAIKSTGGENGWWPHLHEACLQSILGEDEKSLDVLERMVDTLGMPWYPMLRDAACFQKFADEPRYQSVVSSIEKRKQDLRQRLPETLARFRATE
jgi:TolB-like protein/tetratricopeptide (TPR) repeat protein